MPTDTYQHIDQLNADAWAVRVSDSIQSGKYSAEAVEQARACGYTQGLASGLRTLGFFYIRQSNHDQAIRCFNEAEPLLEAFQDQQGISDVKEYRGIVARNLGDLKASLEYLFDSLRLRKETRYHEGESLSLYHLGVTYRYLGNLPRALDFFLESIDVAQRSKTWIAEAYSINNIGAIYLEMGDTDNALDYFSRSLGMRQEAGDLWGAAGCYDNIGKIWLQKNDPAKACSYFSQALEISRSVSDKKGESNASLHLGEAASIQGEGSQAEKYWQDCLRLRQHIGDKKGQSEVLLALSNLLDQPSRKSALEESLALARETGTLDMISQAHHKLAAFYKESGDYAQAYEHLESFQEADRNFHSRSLAQRIANLKMEHDVEQTRKEAEIFRLRTVELAQLVEETERQKQRAEQALESLRATQAQLIQREKMASLGEVTAGIAHEIQNPLNFVNNFSELSQELLEELQIAMTESDFLTVTEIIQDLKGNLEKINHHGKRADGIVKGMLQHSMRSNGQKEPIQVPALVDEYLRLAYHGMRAKETSFDASIITQFEPELPLVPVVAQDIGRVLLNLFNNAFYAVNERKKKEGDGYQPEVVVACSWAESATPSEPPTANPARAGLRYPQPPSRNARDRSAIQITVRDNGTGIPESIRDKIFQPFFTTKPTGQGTGLGLSLSYDIITKGHGGELSMSSTEESGTLFRIRIPVS